MALLNKVMLTGYVGSGMKVKAGGDGTGYTAFRLLVSANRKTSENRFFNCFMGERYHATLKEGDYIFVEGELKTKTRESNGCLSTMYYIDCRRIINMKMAKENNEL